MEMSRMIELLGYLSCRQASSFATLGWIQKKEDTHMEAIVYRT